MSENGWTPEDEGPEAPQESGAEAPADAAPPAQAASGPPPGPLWTGEELEAAIGGRLAADVGDISGVSIDSRTVKPGEAFFAIRGERFDGHQFAVAALTAGAVCAVVARAKLSSLQPGRPYLFVADTLEALGAAGRAARERAADVTAIAITGSVGKTGTKEMLRAALAPSGATHASAASHNNHWGVPLTLARMPRETRFLVSEIGMNHAGEITPLTRMVRPHVAIVTAVEAVHIENFENVEGIAHAKSEIFEGLSPGGCAVVNADNAYLAIQEEAARAKGARIVRFGTAENADVRLVEAREEADGSTVTARLFGEAVTWRLAQPGRHVVMNSLAVAAALSLAGADVEAGLAALADAAAPAGRGARIALAPAGGGRAVLVDESYNANPASVRAALAVLAAMPREEGGRRVLVLGDMLELGADAPAWHRDLVADVEAAGADVVHTVGPLMTHLHDALPAHLRGVHAAQSAALADTVAADVRAGDVVMVKGSNGMRMARIVEAIRARHGAGEGG